jgi:hypothetical protein
MAMSLRAGISSVNSCSESAVRRHRVASGFFAAIADRREASIRAPELRGA